MSYQRVNVVDGVTVMNKALYDNVQDGIDELKEELSNVGDKFEDLLILEEING